MDLIAERIDVAIRAGELKDSSLISKRLGYAHFALFASKKYLKGKEKILHPKDVTNHTCIQFTGIGNHKWEFINARNKVSIPMPQNIVTDDLSLARILTLDHLGLSLLPTFVCDQDVKEGVLTRVLPEWKSVTRPIHLLYAPQKFPTPKLKAFLDIAFNSIKNQLQGTECEFP